MAATGKATPVVSLRARKQQCRNAAQRTRCEANRTDEGALSRRDALRLALGGSALLLQPSGSEAQKKGADVESYLPEPGDKPGWVRFEPGENKTPALRSGAVRPYKFDLPKDAGWKEQQVPNVLTGNYCQPKCDEPTTEVKFASEKEGALQVQIAPLFKVTSEPNPDIKEIGQPMDLVDSFGQYFTGSTIEKEDVIDARKVDKKGQTYYVYEIASPLAISGSHNYGAITFSGPVAVLCTVAASDSQWERAQDDLRKIVDSFEV